MLIHESALKHGIEPDESPMPEFRLGFDLHGRLLELTVLVFDSGNQMVIHAMKARPMYHSLLLDV